MHENLLFQVEHSLTMTSMFQKGERKKLAGWWFGTFGLFFHSVGNVVTPADVQSIILQRGWLKAPTRLLYVVLTIINHIITV